MNVMLLCMGVVIVCIAYVVGFIHGTEHGFVEGYRCEATIYGNGEMQQYKKCREKAEVLIYERPLSEKP